MGQDVLVCPRTEKTIYIDKPTEDEANKMYGQVAGCITSLNDNKRCESCLCHSYIRYV